MKTPAKLCNVKIFKNRDFWAVLCCRSLHKFSKDYTKSYRNRTSFLPLYCLKKQHKMATVNYLYRSTKKQAPLELQQRFSQRDF